MAVTRDRFPYESATEITQAFLDDCQDNLTSDLELVVEIERPDSGYIYASDRNKYLGGIFYEALTNFPIIKRTIGDWLNTQIEFSDLNIEVSNVDGRYNDILPGGDSYQTWIGKSVTVALCLRDESTSRIDIFTGFITEFGGTERTVDSIRFTARDKFDKVNRLYPITSFSQTTFPALSNGLKGKPVPVIYGDWLGDHPNPADIPAYVVNSEDPNMNGTISQTLNVELLISSNANKTFWQNFVFLFRNDTYYLFQAADIVNTNVDNNYFEIKQNGVTGVPGVPFYYEDGDEFFVNVVGVDLGSYTSNMVSIAKDILKTYGDLSDSDFDSSWDYYRDKSSPTQSAIVNMKSRSWRGDDKSIIEEALSLMEQVRLEIFIDRNLKFKLSSLHFEEFEADPDFSLTNLDLEADTFEPRLQLQNQMNRAKGQFDFIPSIEGNLRETDTFRNQAAIDDAGKVIDKRVIFPNLVNSYDVENQVIEILRLASCYIEEIYYSATWRSLLLDISDFVKMNVKIQSVQFTDIPCLIRDIAYDPNGVKVPMKLWSLQMVSFPGYTPEGSGATGGYDATITRES